MSDRLRFDFVRNVERRAMPLVRLSKGISTNIYIFLTCTLSLGWCFVSIFRLSVLYIRISSGRNGRNASQRRIFVSFGVFIYFFRPFSDEDAFDGKVPRPGIDYHVMPFLLPLDINSLYIEIRCRDHECSWSRQRPPTTMSRRVNHISNIYFLCRLLDFSVLCDYTATPSSSILQNAPVYAIFFVQLVSKPLEHGRPPCLRGLLHSGRLQNSGIYKRFAESGCKITLLLYSSNDDRSI